MFATLLRKNYYTNYNEIRCKDYSVITIIGITHTFEPTLKKEKDFLCVLPHSFVLGRPISILLTNLKYLY